jgi:hypothetical protein
MSSTIALFFLSPFLPLTASELKMEEVWRGLQGADSPNCYEDLRFCYLCKQLAYLVCGRIFMTSSEIGELLGSYQEYPAKFVGKQGEQFLKSGVSKKIAGFFIRNLAK